MRTNTARAILLSAACLAIPGLAAAGPKVGGVTAAAGICHGSLDGKLETLAVASAIFLQQELRTGAAARLEITFDDTTQLRLGENAELTVDRFVYDPGKRSRFLATVTGAMRFVGPARKPGDHETVITTPVADIGARGTEFWAGPIDGQYGVLLLEGAVTVATDAGEVVLDEPGEGTNVAARDQPPGPVRMWPAEKVERALAQTAF